MPAFDVSKEWIILLPADAVRARKAAEDLSRYIGLLAGPCAGQGRDKPRKQPVIIDANTSGHSKAIIVLNCENRGPEQNGFSWRAGTEQVEIRGESNRGLCNGIYSFLSALGISWPAPGQETLPSPETETAQMTNPAQTSKFPLTTDKAHEPSNYKGDNPAAAPFRRFVPAGKNMIKTILKNSDAFAAWAARKRYDALVFPLEAFSSGTTSGKLQQLKQIAEEYDISLEAGGRDLSSMVPVNNFLLHRDFFRMVEGRRVKAHHFCPTNPGSIGIINKEAKKLFQAAEGIRVFHLWPDKGAENIWCSCPTCRAFTPAEQNRIAVNAATDVLSQLNPGAYVTYFEKADEEGNIPMRRNLVRLERLPEEKESFD